VGGDWLPPWTEPLTPVPEIENKSSLSVPACDISLSPAGRYAVLTMKLLIALVLPLVLFASAIALALY
jgi:hypothetical protein